MEDLHFQRSLERALEHPTTGQRLATALSQSSRALPERKTPADARLLAWRVLGGSGEMAVQVMVSYPPSQEALPTRRLIPPEPRFDFQARRGPDGAWSTIPVRGTTVWFPGARTRDKDAAMNLFGSAPLQVTPQRRETMLGAFRAWVKTQVPSL